MMFFVATYVLAVKENQGQLYQDINELFEGAKEVNFFDVEHTHVKITNKNHGRIEMRECWAVNSINASDVVKLRFYE